MPQLSGRVVDRTATLGSDEMASLERTLKEFEARKGSQIAVLIVPTTAPESIEQFSIRVAEAWKVGRKKVDDGAILVVAKNDRRLRIEVGYGLEGALNDATAKRIIDEIITPKFRSGDFAGGIAAGVDRIIAVVDGEKLPAPAPARQSSSFSNFDPLNPFVIFAAFALSVVLRNTLGRLLGALATGGIAAALVWFIANSLFLSSVVGFFAFLFAMLNDGLTSSAGRSGGFSSGGGSFSSPSSGGGGFSGGGGSFGGGGASGSW